MTNNIHPTEVVAVIPARGGSKVIPHKNVVQLGKWPLIAWTIKASLQAESVDRTIVSTEDSSIAELAHQYGAEVIARPDELGEDHVPATQVVKHVLDELRDPTGAYPHIVTMLLPTSPFRTAGDIDNSVMMVKNGSAQSVIGVCESAPLISLRHIRDMKLEPIIEGKGKGSLGLNNLQHKDAERLWAVNGAIFTALSEQFMWQDGFHIKDAVPLPMGLIASIQIDTPADMQLAQMVAKCEGQI